MLVVIVGVIIVLTLEMTSSEADALMVNTDGKNGGWTGAVKEST